MTAAMTQVPVPMTIARVVADDKLRGALGSRAEVLNRELEDRVLRSRLSGDGQGSRIIGINCASTYADVEVGIQRAVL